MDVGFDLQPGADDRLDCADDQVRHQKRSAQDADRAIIAVTLCACLLIATTGIIGLMAMGHNVSKEVSLMVGAQWGALLAVHAKGKK